MAGSFKERKNAERQVQKLKSAGFDATIIARVPGTLLTDFSPEEIKEYLSKLRKLIINDKYSIEQNKNRKENIDFIEDYKITTKKEKEINP